MLTFLRRLRRASVLEHPVPEAVRKVVAESVPIHAHLTEDERTKLDRLVLLFLHEKHFEGAAGFEVTDEVRVTIAARACLLVLHRVALDDALYPDLDTIIVYPSAYRAPTRERLGNVVLESDQARAGESWTRGVVVLAWDSVEGSGPATGHDVVVHEFAHQLDGEDGAMDGAPLLGEPRRYDAWARVLGSEFEALTQRVHEGRPSDLDPYGAKSPAEFFAVVSEAFFERPLALSMRHPGLYAELASFYRFDPAARLAPGTQAHARPGNA